MAAVRAIRKVNSEDAILLVTREDFLPYSPAILPYLLSGGTDESKVAIVDEASLKTMGCAMRRGKVVVRVKSEAGEIIYSDGGSEKYDTLLIATGSQPTRPAIAGLEEVGFFGCHTITDTRAIKQRLEKKARVVVYGGGLIALEVAAALAEAGHSVSVVARSRILRRYFGEGAASLVEGLFRDRGIDIFNGQEILSAARENGSLRMMLSSGSLSADLLICCTGVSPSVDLLKGSDIQLNEGVLVDRFMRASLPDIYAAGDVAESVDFFYGAAGVNAIAPNAISQGRIAGSNMAGGSVKDRGWMPMNIFRFFGHTAVSVGLATADHFETLSDRDTRRFKELVFEGTRLVGARFIDVDVDAGVFRYLIEEKVGIKDKKLLFDRPRDASLALMMQNEKGSAR